MKANRSSNISRRTFLKGTALAASSEFAAPTIIPRHVLGSPPAPGANDQILVGIIGMGMRGDQLVMNVPKSGRVAAVCDADLRRTTAAIKKHGADWPVYQDYRKLIERKDLDAVMVATVDHHHVLASMLACQAGKDVYCEKPLGLYVREGRALVQAARKYERVVQTGTQQRTMEMDQFACEFVRDGGIGDIRAVECVNFKSAIPIPAEGLPVQPIPDGVDWDLWQGQAPVHPFNIELFQHWSEMNGRWWGNWREYANSQVTGMGSHAYDMVQYALGMDQTGPVEFWPVDGEDGISGPLARVDFRYANGVEVRLSFPDREPRRGPQLGAVFTGSKCKIEINRNKFTTNPPDFIKHPPDPKLAKKWEGDGYVAKGHVENWFDCIRSREKPNADVEIGHRSASICHLITITRMLGRRLNWDPEKEIFPGDDEANALLDRPRRKGWELPGLS